MSQVAINRCKSPEATPQTLLEHAEAIADSIRKRAFHIFQNRGGGDGSDLQDWLQAERDVILSPASELVEDEKEIRATLALPGFDAKEIQLSVMPDALIVEAGATHSHEGNRGTVRFCEFSEKQLYRRLDLPASIDVDKVTASLDKGMLQITAPKAQVKQMTAGA